MSHSPHKYPGQILSDGCIECYDRAHSPDHGIGNLDQQWFAAAWRRAADWQATDNRPDPPLSATEIPLLLALWAVQVQLEQRGVPIGQVPEGTRS